MYLICILDPETFEKQEQQMHGQLIAKHKENDITVLPVTLKTDQFRCNWYERSEVRFAFARLPVVGSNHAG